jgi:hypothetical protein
LWFRVLGEHLFVERAYSLAAAIGTALLMALIWRRLNTVSPEGPARVEKPTFNAETAEGAEKNQGNLRDLSVLCVKTSCLASGFEWLPILFWIVVPVVSWAIVGNLLDVSLSLLTTAAVAAAVEAGVAARPAASLAWGACSGALVVAAALTKGPVGLFPLAAPVTLWLISGSRRACASLGGQWGTVILCAIALLSFEAPRASLTQYFDQQVVASLVGRREMSAGSWTIVLQLVSGVLAPMILAGAVMVAGAGRYVRPRQPQSGRAAALFLLGLAGTLPIIVSVKQAGHYLVPAVPLYALAAATFLAPTMAAMSERLAAVARDRVVNSLSAVILLTAIGVSFLPALGRDQSRLTDLDVLAATVPRGMTIGICPGSNGEWGLHAWFERRFGISLDASHGAQRDWFLATGAPEAGCPPVGCTPATDPRRELVLMRCSRER